MTTLSDSPVSGNASTPERIDRLFTKFARLSDTELPPAEDYFGLLIDGIGDIVRPAAAAIWWRGPDDRPELIDQVELDKSGAQSEANKAHHEQLLREAFEIPRPLVLPPHGRADEAQGAAPLSANATDYTAIIVPILIEQRITGLIEVWLSEADRPENRSATIQFLVHMAYLASLYLRNRELHRLRKLEDQWKHWQTFIDRVHRGLAPADVASILAAESRSLIGCDRTIVAVRRDGRARMIGLSGPGAMEKQSKIGQCLRKLLQEVDQFGQPVVMSGQIESQWPAPVQKAVEEYVAAGGGPWILAQPLRDNRQGREHFQGVMVLEWLHGDKAPEPAIESIDRLCQDATTALSNASLFQAARRRPGLKRVLAETSVAIVLGVAAGGLFLFGARLMAERRAQGHAIAMLDQTKLVDGARDIALAKTQGAETASRDALAARDRAAGERDQLAQKLKTAEEEKARWEQEAGRLGAAVARVSSERDREAAQLQSTTTERDQYARRSAEMQKERDQARHDMEAAQESAKVVRAAAIAPAAGVSFNVDKMKQEQEASQRQLADMTERLKVATAERDRLQKQETETEAERDRARAQSSSLETAFQDAKKRLQEFEERAATSTKLITSLQARLDRATGEARASATAHHETDKKAVELNREAQQAVKKAAAARAETERLEKQLSDARSHADDINKRLRQTETALSKAQDQLFEEEWAAILASQNSQQLADNDRRGHADGIRLTSRTVNTPPQAPSKKPIDLPVLTGTEDYAVITVLMPSEGDLTFEGDDVVHRSGQRGEKRVFRTPALETEDGTAYYVVAASWTMDSGRTINRRRRVLVEAGKSYNLDLRTR